MTDKELRDAAVAKLKLTTTGYRKSNGQPKPAPWPEGSAHWKPALDLLEQIGQGTPPPPPPPPPPSGTVIYQHDYTGAQAVAPNYGWDYGFLKEGTSTAQIIPDGIAPGIPAMRATLPATTSGNWHVEGQKRWTPWTVGERRFFGFQFKLPANWQNPNSHGWGANIAQLYYPVCAEAPFSLALHGDHCRLVLLTGECTPGVGAIHEFNMSDGGAQGPSPRVIPVGRLTKSVLHTLITEVLTTYDYNGEARCWHKIAGEANYTKTVDISGVPTLQWGRCNDGSYWPKGSVGPDSRGYYIAQKLGFYSGPANWTRTYDSGNYVIADSFDAVASRMA